MLFDIALTGEPDNNGVTHHTPITGGKSIKPFSLKLPSLSLDGRTKNCELCEWIRSRFSDFSHFPNRISSFSAIDSANWVLFQPNIVIDAKLGCLWNVNLKLESLCGLIVDRVRLVEFLLQRSGAKTILINVLKETVTSEYSPAQLTIIEQIFDKLNKVYQLVNHSYSSSAISCSH